jgi:CheY-like chemotaxis protein
MPAILIVDDDEDDRDLFCIAVHDIDPSINCIVARNGVEALQGLRSEEFEKPDWIFLDLNMPRLNGIQCLTELKKDPSLQDIPVIIYTTSKIQEDKDKTLQLGAVHFITKPSTQRELREAIEFVITNQWQTVHH